MAKISARGSRAVQQVKGTKPDDMNTTADRLIHVTVTHRSDGKILRQVAMKYGRPGSYYWSRSNNSVIATVRPGLTDPQVRDAMAHLITRWGYTVKEG